MKHLFLDLAAQVAGWLPAGLRKRLYQMGPVTRLIRRTLNQAAPSGMTEITVAAGLLAGATLTLDLQSEKDMWLGTYESRLLDQLADWIEPGMVVFDVGANIGYLTVGFGRLVGAGGEVHAFEPLPTNLDRLRDSIESNRLAERTQVVPSAVGAVVGQAEFLIHPSGGMGKLQGSHGRQTNYSGSIQAEVITLDDYVQSNGSRPDWVKVDVEGGEEAVLRGARRLLDEIRPGWLMEIHGPEAAAGVWQLLKAAEYALFTIDRPRRQLHSLAELDWKAYLLALPQERIQR